MKTERTYPTHNYNGIWMLVGLVAMLALPLAIGYINKSSIIENTVAEASSAH